MYDIIGDIHGHAQELKNLLKKLGYENINNTWQHRERKALFVGDYIDRGTEIRETLHIVRAMVEGGHAIALMGNHEYNAICFHFEHPTGGHLRKHSIKNYEQHAFTLNQFHNRQNEYNDYINWFMTLPLYYEHDDFRAVHASWDENHINLLRVKLPEGRLNEALLFESVDKETELFRAVEETLKGKEMKLPEGITFSDKEGHLRKEMRIRWWQNPASSTLRSYGIFHLEGLPDNPVVFENPYYYKEEEKPVFFGHYWLTGTPALYRENVCCLDYSVANKGALVAYSWDGERTLENEKFIAVS